MQIHFLVMFVAGAAAQGLDGGGDNKFMKDYALLKIYQSCFGSALLKQITREVRNANIKCAAAPPIKEPPNPQLPPMFVGKQQQELPPKFSDSQHAKPLDGGISNKDEEPQSPDQGQQLLPKPFGGVLSFRPNPAFQTQSALPPYVYPGAFRPYNANPFYPNPYAAPSYYPPNIPYNPFMMPQQYQQGYFQQPYFAATNRMSRQASNYRRRLAMNNERSTQSQNVTCVMQELGYIDGNMEPNYEQIVQRIGNLPVSHELKADIQEGLHFCQKFSQCVPDEKREMALRPHEQIKAVFFFRCYKHKKLEACIMKDINEHYNKEYNMFDSDNDFPLSRQARSLRDMSMRDPSLEALEEMEVYLYDYLNGGGGFDFDLYI